MSLHEPSFEVLFSYIESRSSLLLDDNDRALIKQAFKQKNLRKRQYLLQEGDICKYMAFVVKGAGRMYTINKNGQEHTIRFAIESWWLGDEESFRQGTPSIYTIELTEDAEVLLVTKDNLDQLYDQVPAITHMTRKIDQKRAIATQKRLQDTISLEAEQRYLRLEETYPEIVRRFPQAMVASYLGISAETLSRVRKKLLQK